MLDHLPVELLPIILSKLPSSDLIECRRVTKKIRYLIDNHVRPESLIISFNQIPYNERWFGTCEPLNLDYLITAKNLDFLQNDLVKLIFGKIKSLYIYDFPSDHSPIFDLEELNHYSNIEHLELWFLNLRNRTKLSLPKLNIICVNEESGSTVIINSRLAHFKTCLKIDLFNFNYPLNIRSVQCNYYSPMIKNFSNLEYFCCGHISRLDIDFLQKLKNLKRIQYHDTVEAYHDLKQQKIHYNRPDLEIYFLGINFDSKMIRNENTTSLTKYTQMQNNAKTSLSKYDLTFKRYHLDNHNFEIYFDNCTQLDDRVPFINSLFYNVIEDHFTTFDRIPVWFFYKFPILKRILVSGKVNNLECFVRFIANCKPLNCLTLQNTEITQEYLNRLSLLCRSVSTLSIEENLKNFDFSFIVNFTNLIDLEFKKAIPIELIYPIFSSLKFIQSIGLIHQFHYINVDKNENDSFDLNITNILYNKADTFEDMPLNEIINHLRSINFNI